VSLCVLVNNRLMSTGLVHPSVRLSVCLSVPHYS